MVKIFDKYAIEEVGCYKGYRYVVTLQKLGHRCGYIEVPKSNKYYNVDYGIVNGDDSIRVHGGFTFGHCGEYITKNEEKKYYPLDTPNDSYWLGWDYGHCMDAHDTDAVKKYWEDTNSDHLIILDTIFEQDEFQYTLYTKEMVAQDCKEAIDKLIKFEKVDPLDYCEGCENLVVDTDFDIQYCNLLI